MELKKFSLRPEKFNGKGDFEGWVNQFEEYVTHNGAMTNGPLCCFCANRWCKDVYYRTTGTRKYGQETDTSIALQELA